MEIAIYGKGGIGKSTVAANISAALGKQGKSVLQMGCDPKHDSTRLLLHGEDVMTVLQYMKETGPADVKLGDVVHPGAFGIACVEAGGPEPGVGCAGRGILSTFGLLEDLGLDRKAFDLVLYDVLGDVVCGGFAVPLRQEYADRVYIVTSGEFMAIYAANNILRGLSHYSGEGPRAGGILFNSRGLEEEDERVARFAEAVGLPVLVKIPRDEVFPQAENQGKCVVEAYPDSPVAKLFGELAEKIWNQKVLFPARPLEDEELEEVVLCRKVISAPKKTKFQVPKTGVADRRFLSKSLLVREPLHGCAYNGAVSLGIQLNDGICVSHGPRSCANLSWQSMTSLGRRSLLEKGIVLPVQLRPKLRSTEMGESAFVFGGTGELRSTLEQVVKEKPALITVVTSCPSGIIGDDVESVAEEFRSRVPVVVLKTDGNSTGDYMQGMITAYREIALQLVNPDEKPDKYLVNFYGEKSIANSTSENIEILRSWLETFGAKIHCRYLNDTSVESVRTMARAGLHIQGYHDYMGGLLEEFFTEEFGFSFFPLAFPVGFDASVEFVTALGEFYGEPEKSREIIRRERERYERALPEYRRILRGKRLMIVSYNHHIQWIIKAALDVGMDVVKVGLLNFSQDLYQKSPVEDLVGEWEIDYTQEKRREDVKRLSPDLVISNYNGDGLDDCPFHDTIPLTPRGGFQSGLLQVERWVQIFRQQIKEGWRNDRSLWEKYSTGQF